MVLVVVLGCSFLLTLGAVLGWALAEAALSHRSRRQAILQRQLNMQSRALRSR